jgi:ornithine carbamoyltransferase
MKHLITLQDFSRDELNDILHRTERLKIRWRNGDRAPLLPGRVLVQIFEKPSLRTRISFESAMAHLGGSSVFMSSAEAGLGGRESLEDVARVLSGFADVITLRTFSHQFIVDFASHSSCPVINALSDELHPCQALADVYTMRELFGDDLSSRRLAYIGDGNNVTASLCNATAILGIPMTVCTPPGYELSGKFLTAFEKKFPQASIRFTHDIAEAARDAAVLYTDVWASMGQEAEAEKRKKAFAPYQINGKVLAAAPSDCRFMHCLPAKRGLEVTDDVMDSPQSVVFQQAENRMHLAKGLFDWLLSK